MPGTQQPARLLAESRGTDSKNLLHGTALVFLWHRIHRRTREESKFSQLPLFFSALQSPRGARLRCWHNRMDLDFLRYDRCCESRSAWPSVAVLGESVWLVAAHSIMVRIAEEPIDRVSRAPAWQARRLDKRTLPLRQGRVSSVAPS
jgi:hypothetical protein